MGTIAGCKTRIFQPPTTESQDGRLSAVVKVGGCTVEVAKSLQNDFAASNDPFKERLLKSSNCPTAGSQKTKGGNILAAGSILAANKCKRLGRSLASETAAYKSFTANGLEPRFVEVWNCSGDQGDSSGQIYFAGPEPAFHIIARHQADASKSEDFGFHFYSTDPGKESADFVYFSVSPSISWSRAREGLERWIRFQNVRRKF
jgi:hypothetical protein